jgi:hypothetical protein
MGQDCHVDEHRIVRGFSLLPWIYFALLLGLLAAHAQGLSPRVLSRLGLPILLLPWASGILLLPIWRTGPLKNWAVPWLISLTFPAMILAYGIDLTRTWSSFGGSSTPFLLGVFIAFPVAWYLRFFARMRPRCCPGCGRNSSIPLMHLAKLEKRSGNTRWCAGCGGKYWRDGQGAWQEERRITWHDRQTDRGGSSTGFDPTISTPTRVPMGEVLQTTSTTDA